MFITPLSLADFKAGNQYSQKPKPQITKPMGLTRDTVSFGMAKVPETLYKNTGLLFDAKNPEEVKSIVDGKSELEIQSLLHDTDENGITPAEAALRRGDIDLLKALISLVDDETKPELMHYRSYDGYSEIFDLIKNTGDIHLILDLGRPHSVNVMLHEPDHLKKAIREHDSKAVKHLIDKTDRNFLSNFFIGPKFSEPKEAELSLRDAVFSLKPLTNEEDAKILNSILQKIGIPAKESIFLTAVENNSAEIAKFMMDNIENNEKEKILTTTNALGLAVINNHKEITKVLLESAEEIGEETKQKLIKGPYYPTKVDNYIDSIESVSPEVLSLVFDNADEETSSELRHTIKLEGYFDEFTILSSAIAAGRFDLVPIIVQKNPDSLTDSERTSLARVFNRMGENELEKSLEKSLSIPTIRKNIDKINSYRKVTESIIRYAEKTGNNQLMVDILLNAGDTFHLNYPMYDKARRLAVDSEDISVEDSIRLLKKYGSGSKDKLAIEYLKSMLPEEKTEQQ